MHGTGRPQCRWVFLVLVTAPKAAAKLALREPRDATSGTKLVLHTRNGPFWRVLRVQGELCPAVANNKPSRANFVPHTRWTRSQSTQPHTKRHWCGGRRRDRRARPRCRWVAAGPGRVHQRDSIAGTARTRPGKQKTDIRNRMSACGGGSAIVFEPCPSAAACGL